MCTKDNLIIQNKAFNSRLILGTGKYKNIHQMSECLKQSKSEIITVAIRRLNLLNIKV